MKGGQRGGRGRKGGGGREREDEWCGGREEEGGRGRKGGGGKRTNGVEEGERIQINCAAIYTWLITHDKEGG